MESEAKATIKIPRALYRRLQAIVDRSGFDSVTDFVVYVLRDLVSGSTVAHERKSGTDSAAEDAPFAQDELKLVTERLKSLGYL